MLFNSIEFLFFFLPVTLLLFYVVPARWKLFVTLGASLLFYAWSGLEPFYFMVAGIVWIYLASRIRGLSDRVVIAAGVAFPLFTLIMFRYLDFIFDSVNAPDPIREPFFFFLSAVLPAGISFYTFQMMCYVVDVRRKHIEPPDFMVLASYISFFPQLIAGPIVRVQDVDFQFRRIRDGVLRPDFRTGVKLLAFGLAGKVLLADLLAYSIQSYNSGETASFVDTVFVILAYSLRIYLDFWAYSTMAVGLGKLFSIDLPRNFLEPYFSFTPREFWRRWHVTLSFWLRDYVYIPLGGNRRYIRNILIVFATCGLWHGAGWNFVVWGIYHGLLVSGYRLVAGPWQMLPGAVQRMLTFLLVSLAWPLFFLEIPDFAIFMKGLFVPEALGADLFGARDWLILAVAGLWVFGQREEKWLYPEELRGWLHRVSENPMLQGALIAAAVVFLDFSRTFIYFRF